MQRIMEEERRREKHPSTFVSSKLLRRETSVTESSYDSIEIKTIETKIFQHRYDTK